MRKVSPESVVTCGRRPVGFCARVFDKLFVFSVDVGRRGAENIGTTVEGKRGVYCGGQLVLVGACSSSQFLPDAAKISRPIQQCRGIGLECVPQLFVAPVLVTEDNSGYPHSILL